MKELQEEVFGKISRKDIIKQVLQGLAYIHSNTDKHNNNISHRDVKPENIVIVRLARDGSLIFKFTDFDSAKELDQNVLACITSGVFTEIYKAPEIGATKAKGDQMGGLDYVKGDGYAAGLVVHDVLTDGKHAFEGKSDAETVTKMENDDRSTLIKSPIEEMARNIVWTLTHQNPKVRIPMEEVLNLPYFSDPNTHIQFINVLNETLIQMDDSKLETQRIKAKLNESFFMLFDKPWKTLKFVLPQMLKRSKYSNSVACFFRHNRNLLLHAAQHKELLEKEFGEAFSDVQLLQMILEEVPPYLIHLYWFAKRHLPHLALAKNLPEECALAYEEQMKAKEKELGARLAELRSIVDDEAKAPHVDVDELKMMQVRRFVSTFVKLILIMLFMTPGKNAG